MNTKLMNVISLDDGRIIKKGSGGGGGVTINNQSKIVDITENGTTEVRYDAGYTGLEKVSINVAIPNEEKTIEITENGTTEVVADSGFLSKVIVNTNVTSGGGGTTPSRPSWTGHADVEGLKAIGWTDEDIAYYQENGVNWNAEDDEYHKVSEDNKALYGVLTADNISSYRDRIVYLPKIDTSGKTNMYNMFENCRSLVSIPQLDTQNTTSMIGMFGNCNSLVSIPPLDTQRVTKMDSMFYGCYSLTSIPPLDTHGVTIMNYMFQSCYSLISIPPLDTQRVTSMDGTFAECKSLISIPPLDTQRVTKIYNTFNGCNSLVCIPLLDMLADGYNYNTFGNCYSLTHANIKNAKRACDFSKANLLSKESLLYLINNEAATSAITIKLASYAYTRLANDADIVAALAAHPNISISQ